MKFNQKLINDLREGKIAVDDCGNKEIVESILKETGLPIRNENKHRYYYRNAFGTIVNNFESQGLPIIPAADFLRPEPRFKVGDLVCHVNNSNISGRVTDLSHDGERWVYTVFPYSGVFKEEKIWFASPDEATKAGTEQQFEVGNGYEFSDGEDLVKGKAVGTVDYEGQRNFIAEINGKLSVFESIRSIQPVKISRWINVCPDGRVLRKSYETRDEAAIKAEQGGMADCKQVKLEGTYTF